MDKFLLVQSLDQGFNQLSQSRSNWIPNAMEGGSLLILCSRHPHYSSRRLNGERTEGREAILHRTSKLVLKKDDREVSDGKGWHFFQIACKGSITFGALWDSHTILIRTCLSFMP
jgi:hypothetical protein